MRQVGIGHRGGGIDNAHIHSGGNGMVEEHRVHGFAYIIIASERKGKVAHAAAHVRAFKVLRYPFRGPYEIERVSIVFVHARADSQHVGVENDVGRREACFLREQSEGTLTNLDAPLIGVGLPLLVKSHHDDRCAISSQLFCVRQKGFLALFQRDRIDDALALNVFQRLADDFPF